MSGLARLLGHDVLAAEIAQALLADEHVKILQGPPGCGKTWIAKALGGAWEEAGGRAIVATGDSLQADSPLHPLKFALAALAPAWRPAGRELGRTGSAGESLLGTGGILTATVQAGLNLRPSRVRARKLYLGEDEQTILFDVARLAKDRPILLICDNLHWWDSHSLQFLGRLREARMAEAFPFLLGLQVLGVQALPQYQAPSNPHALAGLLSPVTTTYFDLDRAPRRGFDQVLVELGARPDEAADVGDAMYGLTGGHLALAARCVSADRSLRQLVDGTGDEQAFLRAILVERLRVLGAHGERCIKLLQVAAILGFTFGRDELVCASGEQPGDAAQLLHACRAEDLIELVNEQGVFASDLFRQHFLGLASGDSIRLNEAIGSCLRKVRPSAYEARCQHAVDSDDHTAAATLAALAVLQRARQAQSIDDLPPAVRSALEASALDRPAGTICRAMDAADRGDYVACGDLLDELPHLPRPLTAEVDILAATCLVESRNEADRLRAVDLLSGWDGYEEEEPDVGLRLLNAKLYALSLGVDRAEAREVELRLRNLLLARQEFDAAASDSLHVLDRCSGRLDSPEKSLRRVQRAVEFFTPPGSDIPVRRPIELYWALSNLVAKQVTNAQYRPADQTGQRLEHLINDYIPGTFPRLDFARSNTILAGYRSGRVDVEAAVVLQRAVVDSLAVSDDRFYSENALAVYELLSGRPDDALARFAALHAQLRQRERPVASLLYLIGANRAAARFTESDVDSARSEWADLEQVVVQIPYSIRPYLVRRHQLLGEIMATHRRLSPREFDECLLDRQEIGPQWDQLGRGFRMPEVEWWR